MQHSLVRSGSRRIFTFINLFHRWPSGRPDDVINIKFVTEQASTSVISEKDYIDSIAPKRKKWTRGLRETPDCKFYFVAVCPESD